MYLELDGLSNPGWYFSKNKNPLKDRMLQLEEMLKYIESIPSDDVFNYKKLREDLANQSETLDSSKIRMFFPTLQYYGVFNAYDEISLNGELLTEKLGRGFLDICILYNRIDTSNLNGEQKQAILDVFEKYMFEFYKNICTSEKGAIYNLLVTSLRKYNHISFNEFYVLTHSITNKLSVEWTEKIILSMRKNISNLDVSIKSNKNTYGYIIPFMKQAGMIKEENRVIYPNNDKNFNKEIN